MGKISRRDFIKITGGAAAGAAAGILLSGTPARILKELAELSQNGCQIPGGEQRFLQSICARCNEQCQITLRLIDKRIVKIESSNFFCPFGQASLQHLYHPKRILQPLMRSGEKGSGSFSPVSWEEAANAIAKKIDALIAENKQSSIAAISSSCGIAHQPPDSHEISSGRDNESPLVLKKFMGLLGSPHFYDGASPESLEMPVLNGTLQYDFENAGLILCFRAALFDRRCYNAAAQKLLRHKNPQRRIIYIGSNCNRTASIADEWIPVKPGTEAVFALGMAKYLLREKRLFPVAVNTKEWIAITESLDEAALAQITGVTAKKIYETAEEFFSAKNPAAVSDSAASASTAELTSVYALNSMVRTSSVSLISAAQEISDLKNREERFNGLDAFISQGSFDMLFINDSNPVYSSVLGKELSAKMKGAFVVTLSCFMDESALYADFILPALSPLERISFAPVQIDAPIDEESGPAEPFLLKQQGDAKCEKDIMALIANKIKHPIAPPKQNRAERTPERVKNFALKTDLIRGQLDAIKNAASNSDYPLSLIALELPLTESGRMPALPYVSKALDKDIFENGRLKLHINRRTAEKYKLSEGSSASLASEHGTAGPFTVHITDTIAPDVVSVPLGFGHTGYGLSAKTMGANLKEIMNTAIDAGTGAANNLVTPVRLVK